MTSNIERAFAPAKDSLDWANAAIDELKASVQSFFHSDATEVVTEYDSETRKHVQKVRLRNTLPSVFARKTTEALTNARHSFDKGLFAARNLTSGRSSKSVYYPWSQTPHDLERLLDTRGIDKRLWDTISSHEPYPRSDTHSGGDDLIRSMATLANGKHTIGLYVNGHISSTTFPKITGEGVVRSLEILRPKWDPVKNEANLVQWMGDVTIQGDYRFEFEIIFKDARFPQPVNAISGLSIFSDKAKSVIESLQARCETLLG